MVHKALGYDEHDYTKQNVALDPAGRRQDEEKRTREGYRRQLVGRAEGTTRSIATEENLNHATMNQEDQKKIAQSDDRVLTTIDDRKHAMSLEHIESKRSINNIPEDMFTTLGLKIMWACAI